MHVKGNRYHGHRRLTVVWRLFCNKVTFGLCCAGLAFVVGFVVHRNQYHRSIVGRLRPLLSKQYLQALLAPSHLPVLTMDIKPKHWEKLCSKRRTALATGILLSSDDDLVPASLHYDNRDMHAQVRLKGDWTDHLEGHKWSFRVHIAGDDQVLGMRRISLHHPAARNYLDEWGFMSNLRAEGILAPRYEFVTLQLNGQDKGIYALEEHVSKEMLAAQHRREGVIVKPDEGELWEQRARLGAAGRDMGLRRETMFNYPLVAVQHRRIDSDPVLSRQRDEALGLLRAFVEGRRTASEVFDVDLMARYMALAELWRVQHGLWWHNCRFYFNPLTARLEPIGFDAEPLDSTRPVGLLFRDESYGWCESMFRDPVIAEAYLRYLRRFTQPAYLDGLKRQLDGELRKLMRTLTVEFPLDRRLQLPWARLQQRQQRLRRILAPQRMVLAYERGQAPQAGELLTIELRNVLSLPVEVLGLQIGDEALLPASSLWRPTENDPATFGDADTIQLPVTRQDRPPHYSRFQLPEAALGGRGDPLPGPLHVLTRLAGDSRVIRTPVCRSAAVVSGFPYELATVSEVLEAHDFIESEGDRLVIRKGSWQLHNDLIVPKDVRLQIEPGTTMQFDDHALIVAQSAVELAGTAEEPIVLRSAGESWSGMVITGARAVSVLDHVVVSGARGVQRGGWTVTGGVTFINSPVLINHCRFEQTEAADALNIVNTNFEVHNSYFTDCRSDALDVDAAFGTVSRCAFERVLGDGIDASASEVHIAESMFSKLGDKAVSAGENSTVRCQGLGITRSRFGVVSKDLSSVYVRDCRITEGRYGLAAFVKKPEFGAARIRAYEIRIDQVAQPVLVQQGCEVFLEGVEQPTQSFDADELYDPVRVDRARRATGIVGWLNANEAKPLSDGLRLVFVGHIYRLNGNPQNGQRSPDDGQVIGEFLERMAAVAPARVIFGGDSVIRGTPASLEYLRQHIARPLQGRSRFLLGNHDVSPRGGVLNHPEYLHELYDRPYYYEDLGRLRLIYLSSVARWASHGDYQLGERQLEFLRLALAGNGFDSVLVFLHHPLWLGELSRRYANEAYRNVQDHWQRDVLPILKSGRVKAVFAGDGGYRASGTVQHLEGIPHYLTGWSKNSRTSPLEYLGISVCDQTVQVRRHVMYAGKDYCLLPVELSTDGQALPGQQSGKHQAGDYGTASP